MSADKKVLIVDWGDLHPSGSRLVPGQENHSQVSQVLLWERVFGNLGVVNPAHADGNSMGLGRNLVAVLLTERRKPL